MKKIINLLLLSLISTLALGQEESAEELSQQAANPIADLMSFPFQNNYNINQGPHNRNVNVMNIQPVIPFANGKIITRTILPIVNIPDFENETGKMTSGLSDVVLTAFYVPKSKNVTWGFGPVVELPTGGSLRGSEKWSTGPSVLALIQPGDWTFGLLANNVWSVAGNKERDEVNNMMLNLFIVKQLGEGWYINSAPIITADWTAESGQQWIVPVGGGGGKLFFLGGKLPINLQTQLYYNAIRPDFGSELQLRVQAQILLPKSILSRK
ncbi:hypothetical protein [Flammeovirga sp. OC4]|uniref:hypothetical protein n=1 Tax=Flammeovirga sp. OC4 TaxID=1382345 RepID=UPI0005C69609|nr:hypothetical protein [Flammeovirga sp. OC4]